MASTETKVLDNIISSRRALLLGGAALGAAALVGKANAAQTVTTYTDNDILNFALNLEYLEANFYYLAAFGTTIDVSNPASIAAGGPSAGIGIGANGAAATGGVVATTTATNGNAGRVPFTTIQNTSYANEIAIEEGKHVLLLRSALGSVAVGQPMLDVSPKAFTTVANAAGIAGTFSPYASGLAFLVGAYVFEDVGVTAYHGAAPLITSASILATAASILAVEAYHSGIVRQSILAQDTTGTYVGYTTMISALRAKLSLAAAPATPPPASPDDYGLQTLNSGQPTTGALGAAGTSGNRSQTADADNTNFIAFSRSTTQVLNIVTGGGALTAGATAMGVFFPAGMNGTFK